MGYYPRARLAGGARPEQEAGRQERGTTEDSPASQLSTNRGPRGRGRAMPMVLSHEATLIDQLRGSLDMGGLAWRKSLTV